MSRERLDQVRAIFKVLTGKDWEDAGAQHSSTIYLLARAPDRLIDNVMAHLDDVDQCWALLRRGEDMA